MRTVVAGLAVVGMLALSGCVEGDPIPTLPPTPSSTPLFASEEEAFAAAEEAYAEYSAVTYAIVSEGGAEPERIGPYVTPSQLVEELDGARFYSERGWRVVGEPLIQEVTLQQWNETPSGTEVAIYVCLDVSDVRVVDASGSDVTPADRDELVALEVLFQSSAEGDLLVAGSEPWQDSAFC